jgi:galactonate dehydratase
MYTANNGQINFMLTAANAERYPYFADGADTRLVPNDGTPAWRKLYDKARQNGPIEA